MANDPFNLVQQNHYLFTDMLLVSNLLLNYFLHFNIQCQKVDPPSKYLPNETNNLRMNLRGIW